MGMVEFYLSEDETEELVKLAGMTLAKFADIIKRHLDEYEMSEKDRVNVFRFFNYMLASRYVSMLLEMLNYVDHDFAIIIKKLFGGE